MCVRCGTGAIAWCTHPTRHEPGKITAAQLAAYWQARASEKRHNAGSSADWSAMMARAEAVIYDRCAEELMRDLHMGDDNG